MSTVEMFEPVEMKEMTDEGKRKMERLFYHCNVRLGGTGIPVHLERDDYVFALESAVNMYRTRSSRSINQTFAFLEFTQGQQVYQLNERVDVVKRIRRGGLGGFGSTGTTSGGIGTGGGSFESFGAATAHLLLRGGLSGSGGADLATFDFIKQKQETLEKLFATEINFNFRVEDHTLMIFQPPVNNEMVLLELSVLKTMTELLCDHWAYDWLQKYTLAVSKTILGEKYSLFATIAGPQGGTVMKGEQLKQAGEQEMEKLEDELMEWGDSSDIPMPIRG